MTMSRIVSTTTAWVRGVVARAIPARAGVQPPTPSPVRAGREVSGSQPGMQIGYFLSSEECAPGDLVDQARRAEAAGFHALWISDHYHPWIAEQGHSPFVWSVIGAVSAATNLP